MVANGDVLTDLDLTALVGLHRDRGARMTLALHPVDDPSRYGVVVTAADGAVTAFVEKPRAGRGRMPSRSTRAPMSSSRTCSS